MGVRKRNNKWWVDFCFNRSRYRRPSPENSRAGALAWELVLKQKLARGEPLDPEREKTTTFKDFAQDWFETYVKNNNKHSEILSKEKILRVHLIPYFGSMKLDEIKNLDIEKYKAKKIQGKLSPKTINNHLTVFRKACQCALDWGAAKACPTVKRLKTPSQKYDFLTPEECRNLLAAADEIYRDMIMVALGTGLRFGELIALSWEDVDFKTGDLTIRQSYAMGVLGSTKSDRIRHIPISDSVRHTLYRMRKDDGFVFTDTEGNPLNQCRCVYRLYAICKKAGLRKIGWHTLRHTFASHLVQAGANLGAIQGLLGHSDIRTTMRYAHINRAALREAIGILDKVGIECENDCHNSVTIPTFHLGDDKLLKAKKAEIRLNKNKMTPIEASLNS
jgi:integrase